MTERSRLSPDLVPGPGAIILAWTVVAFAYTPALVMTSGAAGPVMHPLSAFLFVALGFMPWALATRPLIALCTVAPLGSGSDLRSLALLGAVGLLVLPTLAIAGTALAQAAGALFATDGPALSGSRIARAATINAFFSVPTYAAVIGVGQTLVYLDRTRTRERLLARARLEALRAQINPHFLFNALGAIAQLAHRDADRAERAANRLADVLRSTLASDAEAIPLSAEMASVMDQVELHRMLLPAELDLRLTIAPDAWHATVPAMLLQPLVENAVTHGLSRLTSGLWLAISAEVEGGKLRLKIANARPAEPQPSRGLGIGLSNTAERLRALYGDAARHRTTADDSRFIAEIELPFVCARAAEDALR